MIEEEGAQAAFQALKDWPPTRNQLLAKGYSSKTAYG